MVNRTLTILGIEFLNTNATDLVAASLGGGLVIVPSAPVLVSLQTDLALRRAVIGADLAVADSGLMVLVFRILNGVRILRVSGLNYLVELLKHPSLHEQSAVVWVMPTAEAKTRLERFLQKSLIPFEPNQIYVAPFYGREGYRDHVLLDLVREARPRHVIIGLGGGVQEPLGLFLKEALTSRPSIHCIGAAIGFITGDQVRIPTWVDRTYLGWLLRICGHPTRFWPRYWQARKLVGLMWRYRDKMPPFHDKDR